MSLIVRPSGPGQLQGPRDAVVRGLARPRRQRDDIVNWRGQEIYDHIEANLHYEVLLSLGKLEPVVHMLRKGTGSS